MVVTITPFQCNNYFERNGRQSQLLPSRDSFWLILLSLDALLLRKPAQVPPMLAANSLSPFAFEEEDTPRWIAGSFPLLKILTRSLHDYICSILQDLLEVLKP